MGKNRINAIVLVLLIASYGVILATGYDEEEGYERERGRGEREYDEPERGDERGRGRGGSEYEPEEGGGGHGGGGGSEGGRGRRGRSGFLLQDSREVIRTDAGMMRVVRSAGGRIIEKPMHIGFLTMEPKSLFVPQYLDSSLIIFVTRGEARLGSVYKNDFAERRLKSGDIYRIPAGSAFYLVNTGQGQRLHIICSIDPSEGLGFGTFKSFYIGGGRSPTSVLSGFGVDTLATAFNVSGSELREIMTTQTGGPIVYIADRAPTVWTKFLELKEQDKQNHLNKLVGLNQEPEEENRGSEQGWSWRKLLGSVLGAYRSELVQDNPGRGSGTPDSYNLYDRKADFRNDYGWSVALDSSDYKPLKHSGIGVYLVNLTAGAMMAPHVNPTATEYGIVLRGSGRVQIVYPNGSAAMDTEIKEGDVFWVPRYFPFCQIASRTGPLEFFGFTTSARKNWPQFLVGANSLLRSISGPELAAAFGVDEERMRTLLNAQRESVILPTPMAAPPDEAEKRRKDGVLEEGVAAMGREMIMELD